MKTNHTSNCYKSLAVMCALIGLIYSQSQAADDAPYFHHDYNTALASASKAGKPLIVVFSASWCPPCQKMKKNVYPSSKVQPYHESFVWAYLDADESKNKPLMSKFGVNGIPHITFARPDGSYIGHFAGSVSPTQFTGILDKVKIDAKRPSGSGSTPQPGSGSGRKGSGNK
ncbi:MAG: thioredoxin family protein [Verrucomicrobiales bacterium]|nr:thioredoxin family protein [Verrucomicrobiales bacterium]